MSKVRSAMRRKALEKAAAAPAGVMAGYGKYLEDNMDRLDPEYAIRGIAAYTRAMDPANVGAAAGIVGGAGLLGSSVLPGKKSKAERLAKGVAGAGLLGGGIALSMNDKARSATRKAVLSLVGRAYEPFRTKMAEDHSFGNRASELVGLTVNPEILALLGGAVTAPVGGVGAYPAAIAGGIGRLVGPIAALIKKQRSRADQRAYDSESHALKNILMPGAGSYNFWKRLGHADK